MNPRRLKLSLVLASAALSALTLLAWTQQWFTVALDDGQELLIGGDVAAPALSALALAGLVLVGAVSIAGTFFRFVLAALQLLIGVAVILSATIAIGSPISASASSISLATGVGGTESIAALVSRTDQTAWPWLTVILGALISLVAVLIIVTARAWSGANRKYQTVRMEPTSDERSSVDDWDALTDGTDPT
ncbi:MAG: Trp biosynthesis-associated membrane protein [Microbacteriaceae bacterium]